MAEFKKGDRVRVSYEGVVIEDKPHPADGSILVESRVGEHRNVEYVFSKFITPVPPPPEYKPGDKVKFKDGTVGEVYADHANTARKGFVCVTFQQPQATINRYVRVPASEIEPYTEPAPPTPVVGAMPPYWIDVEEDGTTFVGRVYDTATAKVAHKTPRVYPRFHAILSSLEWVRSQGAKS